MNNQPQTQIFQLKNGIFVDVDKILMVSPPVRTKTKDDSVHAIAFSIHMERADAPLRILCGTFPPPDKSASGDEVVSTELTNAAEAGKEMVQSLIDAWATWKHYKHEQRNLEKSTSTGPASK